MIAHHRELAQDGIEHVGDDITYLPGGRDGLEIPFFRAEAAQQLDELGVDAAKQVGGEDGIGTREVLRHGKELWYRPRGEY